MSVEGLLPRTVQPFKATKTHPRISRLPECSSLMLTLWAPSSVFSLPEDGPMFCLNWTCLASEQEETGTGMCGCALLALGTDLARDIHGCGSHGEEPDVRCLSVVGLKAETFMESSLLSVLAKILVSLLHCGCSVEFLTITIMTAYHGLCAAAWSVTLGLLELGIVMPRLIHAPRVCQHEPSVCRTQCSPAVLQAPRSLGVFCLLQKGFLEGSVLVF